MFVRAGALQVGETALYISVGILAGYFLSLMIVEVTGHTLDPWMSIVRYLDIMATTVVLIAMHDVTRPVWAVYFLTIGGSAHIVGRREMAVFVAWGGVNFLAAAAAQAAMGYPVPWAYVLVVFLIIGVMGVNATVLAGGQLRMRDLLRRAATTDSLTGIANRHHFRSAFPSSLEEAIASGSPLAFMLVDVDHFKEINDRYGHPAGDDKLREIAAAMSDAMRASDLLARYGGDEFSVVAPRAMRADALALAERLRQAAAGCGASVSIGVAIFPDDAQREDALIAAADRALYLAKEAGRDCVRDALAA